MRALNKPITVVLAAMLLSACATTKTIYYWADYSESAYEYKATPTDETLREHRKVLHEIVAKAQSKNQKIPPGIYMELAMLEIKANNFAGAKQLLLQEKALFPESITMVDAVLNMIEERESENASNN